MLRSIVSICLIALLGSACRHPSFPVKVVAGPNLAPADLGAITRFYFSERRMEVIDSNFAVPASGLKLPTTIQYYYEHPTGRWDVILAGYGDASPDPIAVAIGQVTLVDGTIVDGGVDGALIMVLDPLVP